MAKTKLHNYTVQEKLNKMDVDVIDVTVKPDFDDGGIMSLGDWMFPMVEIPNAVAVPGGSSILTSCCAIIAGGDDDGLDIGAFDIVITSYDSTTTKLQFPDNGGTADIETDNLVASITDGLAIMDGTCGWFSISNAFNAGTVAIGTSTNIGMVCKAEADSTSLYVWGVVQNTANYNEGDIVLRLGFIKD